MTGQFEPSDHSFTKTLLVLPWDEERGGVMSVVENLAKYLQSHGQDVLFFYPGKAIFLKTKVNSLGFPAVELRITVPMAGPRPLRSALAFPLLFPIVLIQLIWFLWKEHIRIVNIHYPHDSFFYFAICRQLLPIRLITSIHGSDAFSGGIPRDKYSWAFRYLLERSDQIVLPSNTYRNRILARFPHIREKTTCIHNGVDPAQFSFSSVGQNNGTKSRYILCIAHLKPYKGIDLLLRATKQLLDNDPSLRLVIAGDGPMRVDLEELATSLGIYNQTDFLGAQGPTEITTLLHCCELLVLPSREESFGIVLLEGMVCKKPVVAAAVGGVPEIIEDGVSGLLVEPENPTALLLAMRRVLRDRDLRRRLAENGYSRVMERFRFDHTGYEYLKVLGTKPDLPEKKAPHESGSEISVRDN